MSRLGKLPIKKLVGGTIEATGHSVSVKGPKGSMSLQIPQGLEMVESDDHFMLNNKLSTKQSKANHGTYKLLIENMIVGVTQGWSKTLEVVGTGYRANLEGKDLVLTIGFSHPVVIQAPDGITFAVEKSIITITGVDKQAVGQIAANIRAVRPPEPYKGKGIKYTTEIVRRKAGKAAKAAGGA